MSIPTERPLRADARRNRERVLEGARAVFAEHGRDAQMDDVARKAGVGVGTVYRHFPTKEALVSALAVSLFEQVLASARRALEIDDPWEAFTTALWAGVEVLASDRAFTEIIGQAEMPFDTDLMAEMNDAYMQLVQRAKDSGDLRPDIVLDDIPMFTCGIGMATVKPHMCQAAWRRHLAIIIDGLRATNASGPLPS
ncbi:TetR/AcrR family transcriptional regulator [Solirubrobacter sp. CPCC 204708]|uniref:TetR/AcrR family transcriptional regulator n=1 Tax=Solirubrobacter deserti TaxID=2282478 RepID=A0ABT4RIX0_9ACTN|nr:TetR/AcrR family transcriptional regulator [Solirubrobacter deserti]MBE2320868.1 TetR/AcrR family transcriptional regulator [Solirubrobacter deserti]MDA0138503.1 TetR/AcrR family transcriptional regulator [Solirubrobacter deserti]